MDFGALYPFHLAPTRKRKQQNSNFDFQAPLGFISFVKSDKYRRSSSKNPSRSLERSPITWLYNCRGRLFPPSSNHFKRRTYLYGVPSKQVAINSSRQD
jgi:hypothetical protein